MALTTILREAGSELADVDRRIREKLRWTRALEKPLSSGRGYQMGDWGLVGTAFDFWLRGYLIVTYGAQETETVLDAVSTLSQRGHFGRDPKVSLGDNDQREYLPDAVARISAERRAEIAAGRIFGATFLYNCIAAARLEGFYRRGKCSAAPNGNIYGDLEALGGLTRRMGRVLEGKTYELNPQFPVFGTLLKGTDADFGVDDMLVEIKCSKELCPGGAAVQVLAYILLMAHEHGIRGTRSPYRRIGIYSARYGALGTANAKDLLEEMNIVQGVIQRSIRGGEQIA